MTLIQRIAIGAIAILSAAAGGAKVAMVPNEAAFFEGLNLSLKYMMVLGVVQIAAALLILLPKFRMVGAALAAMGFLISAVMIFKNGQTGFAAVSLIPVLLAGYVATLGKK
ncbi:MAG: hypothetical protein HKN36_02990 [Hellea sp.]|nr:hypothetical protein [Hellea sp.]